MHNYAYCDDIMLKYVSYVLGPRSANRLPTSRQLGLNKPIVKRCAVKTTAYFGLSMTHI